MAYRHVYGLSMVNQPVIPSNRLSKDAKKLVHPFVPGHGIGSIFVSATLKTTAPLIFFLKIKALFPKIKQMRKPALKT